MSSGILVLGSVPQDPEDVPASEVLSIVDEPAREFEPGLCRFTPGSKARE